MGRRLFRGDKSRGDPGRRSRDHQTDGYNHVVRGHVGSVASGINVPNAQPDQAGLASVNSIFTWVRLAQRVPVHIDIDQAPKSVRLVVGMTATVQIDRRPSFQALRP
jgi:multidrug resistance efflux pump